MRGKLNHEGKKAPRRGPVFRSYDLSFVLCIGAFLGVFIAMWRASSNRFSTFPHVELWIAGIFLVLALFATSHLMIDLDGNEIRTVSGIWPFVRVTRYSFTEVATVTFQIDVYSDSNSTTTSYPVRIRMASGHILGVKNFPSLDAAAYAAQELAMLNASSLRRRYSHVARLLYFTYEPKCMPG